MNREEFIQKMFGHIKEKSLIEQKYYDEYNIKRGLRNANGTGVLVGITRVADVEGYTVRDGKKVSLARSLPMCVLSPMAVMAATMRNFPDTVKEHDIVADRKSVV